MKKSSYSITHKQCLSSSSFLISQSILNTTHHQQGTITSQIGIFKQSHIGTLIDQNPPCWCLSNNIQNMQLIMYDQHLSIASTYNKHCLFVFKKQITVITAKKVKVGKVIRKRICCNGCFVQILDSQDKFIYGIQVTKCQFGDWVPNCLGWLRCGKPINYDICDGSSNIVGKIQVYSDLCCNNGLRYQIQFPNQADTKAKILLMNSIAILK